MKGPVLLAFLLTTGVGIFAQDDSPLLPAKISNPPVIDGVLDDQVWKDAPMVTGFKTFSPDYGLDMSQKTNVFMLYDEENLYFAFECYDSEVNKLKASVNARDNIQADDWICINLDSFNDHQSLYAFYVNPHGIQADSRFSGGKEDASVDFVWYSSGKIYDDLYRVEIQIPLKSIRFSNKEPVEMAVFFERKISREAVQGSYPAMDPARGMAFLTQMKPMIYNKVRHYKLFELLPAFTYTYRDIQSEGEMRKDIRSPKPSLTLKYGITSQLILDGTLNPDFSQVEADAGQVDVNLRYKIFYPEKRPFFLEGHENFNIAATRADEHDPVNTLLHTRSIINPLTGIKLSGKAGERMTIAALYALDRVDNDGQESIMAHFPILRMKYSLARDSYLGGMYTGREMDTTSNRVAGLDGQVRVGKGSSILYNAFLSSTVRSPGASPLQGHMLSAEFEHDSRNIAYSVGAKSISEDFNAETGFINRDGIDYLKVLVKPRFYPGSDFIQRVDVEAFSKATRDRRYEMWETVDHLASWIFFRGSTYIKLKAEYSTEVFLGERFKTGGFHGLLSSQIGKKLNTAFLYQRLGSINYSADPFQGISNHVMLMAGYKPSEKLHLDFSYRYSDLKAVDTGEQEYNYSIARGKVTYQLNKYFFVRAISEYNSYRENLLTDFLASFTWIPGTVVYLGYGSVYDRVMWDGGQYSPAEKFLETTRGFFFKASYMYRF
ncbi:MAG: DUF5916 domain-containing protein [Marinilabiliaceae bacterium]|jgi:hypothetical protein|nr:DUF5916 domain-containing protein [Marinilabiliaceae bacterium]